jgi:hypothetical protein
MRMRKNITTDCKYLCVLLYTDTNPEVWNDFMTNQNSQVLEQEIQGQISLGSVCPLLYGILFPHST